MTVATLGKTNDFPAFYTPKSGFKSPWSMETAQEAARMIRAFLLRHFSHSLYCVQHLVLHLTVFGLCWHRHRPDAANPLGELDHCSHPGRVGSGG